METRNTGDYTAPPGEAQHLRKRFNSLTRTPLRETNSNIPSPILKKAKLNNGKVEEKSQLKYEVKEIERERENKWVPAVSKEIVKGSTKENASIANVKENATATHKESGRHEKTGRLAGEELYHWQQSWRKIMKESTVYFEGITDSNAQQLSEYKKASKYLKQVGCEISPFYDNDVTIIVSRRAYNAHKTYPANDIFSNVSQLKIKVWDYDKVFRFLKNLGVNVASGGAASSASNDTVVAEPAKAKKDNLYTLLKEEKIYGTTDRDPNAKRDDLHYLEKNYLFVYDLSQKVRPIAVREWGDNSYPILHLSLDGKCPFIFEPIESHKSERKRYRRLQKFEATKEYRAALRKATHEIMSAMHTPETETDEDQIDTSSTDHEKVFKQPRLSQSTAFAPPPLARYSSCVQPANTKFQEVAASGYNGASGAVNFSMDSTLNSAAQGNGLGPAVSQVPSRNLNNLKRRITLKRKTLSYEKKEEKELNPGYCENCRVKYDHFDDHIRSNRHRNFASDDRNFKEIDRLITTLNGTKSSGYVTSNGEYRYV